MLYDIINYNMIDHIAWTKVRILSESLGLLASITKLARCWITIVSSLLIMVGDDIFMNY